MSERPSEYLKRTCLICGCHTNQTINIYEPRSGPNIVQLIQAKFKFQPLNEDKYLCFSCNNWLINWHSLQAVNSNDAENGSHVNSMAAQHKGDGGQNQAATRPVAQVKPMRIVESKNECTNDSPPSPQKHSKATAARASIRRKGVLTRIYARRKNRYTIFKNYNKTRNVWHLRRRSKTIKKQHRPISYNNQRQRQTQQESKETHTLAKETVQVIEKSVQQSKSLLEANCGQREFLKRPLVDGKVVSMLRRLGTSLTRETENTTLPPIMSPTKPKPRWTRPLDADEIVLSFDNAVTEVLPHIVRAEADAHISTSASNTVKRRLSYQQQTARTADQHLQSENYLLPKELVISLI